MAPKPIGATKREPNRRRSGIEAARRPAHRSSVAPTALALLGPVASLGDDRVQLDDEAVAGPGDIHPVDRRRCVLGAILEAEVAEVVELRRRSRGPEDPVRMFRPQLFSTAFEVLAPTYGAARFVPHDIVGV